MKPVAWVDRDGHYIRAVFYSAAHKLNLPRRTKLYTADQLRQAKVEVLRTVRERLAVAPNGSNPLLLLDKWADEIERSKT